MDQNVQRLDGEIERTNVSIPFGGFGFFQVLDHDPVDAIPLRISDAMENAAEPVGDKCDEHAVLDQRAERGPNEDCILNAP